MPCQLSDAEPIRTSRVFPPFWIASASQSAMELRPHHSRLLLVPKNNSLTKRNACLRELPSGMGLSRSGAKFHPQGAGCSCRDHSRRDSRRRCGPLSGQPSSYRVVGSGAHVPERIAALAEAPAATEGLATAAMAAPPVVAKKPVGNIVSIKKKSKKSITTWRYASRDERLGLVPGEYSTRRSWDGYYGDSGGRRYQNW